MKTTVLLIGLVLALPGSARAWVARYDGPAGDEDYARAIAVDDAGNIYVTGSSWGVTTGSDYATVKYAPDGTELWVARYDGPASGFDEAAAIAVQGERVAVTGGSAGPDLFADALTVVYDLDGNELWTARFDGPNNGNDMGLAVCFDPDGNVIVAGYSLGSDILWDFITIKYDPEGNQLWTARYATDDEDYAVAVATDRSGNIFITGPSGCPYTFAWDYLTIKYDPEGSELWVRRYNGPADEHDEPRALAVDAAGNVYVTGGSTSHGSGADFTTIKYSPGGDTLWLRRYDGPAGSADWANAIALDPAGNVYVTGSSIGETSEEDFATIKYSPDGTELWVARYDGPASGFDEARAVAVDDAGNIYVTGASWGDGTRTDYATVKYGPDGVEHWVRRYDGPANRFDEPVGLLLDRAGGVIVTGSSVGVGTGTDYATVRYSAAGVRQEQSPPLARSPFPGPTIIRGILSLPASFGARGSELIASDGRRVMTLAPGENDVRHLAPGVYFIRAEGSSAKVVIQR